MMVSTLWSGSRTILVALNGRSFPSDAEWSDYMALARRGLEAGARFRALSISDGGGPTGAQRHEAATLAGSDPHAALVSSSRLARGIATALSWFFPSFKVFAPREIARALRWLDLPEAEVPALWEAIRAADAPLGLQAVAEIDALFRATSRTA
jgi:hypothetical protein